MSRKNDSIAVPKRRPMLTRIGLRADIDYFVENLAVLVASGMGIVSALESIKAEVHTGRMKRAIAELIEDVNDGVPLARALEGIGVFPAHAISLIRIGEESGKLSQNLKVMARQQEKDRLFSSKIKSAMMYPVFVFVLTLVIGVGIAWFILPNLATVFSQLHLKLPLITKVLIATGLFFKAHGSVVVPLGSFVLLLLFYIVFGFSKTKWIGQGIALHLPGIGRLIKESEVARFGYLLSSLLDAGLPVAQALGAVRDAAESPRYKKLCTFLYTSINDGNSFQKSFAAYPKVRACLPMPVQQLIVSGEQSGNLPQVLQKFSEQYEEKTDTTAKNLSTILEPILLVIVWLGVVTVALAVILPIYSLVGGLGNQIDNPTPAPAEAVAEAPVEAVVQAPIEQSASVPGPAPTSIPTTTPKTTPATIAPASLPKLRILGSPLGYVNVRSGASTATDIVAKAYLDEIYEYTSESTGWYKIVLSATSTGWVAGKYIALVAASSTP